MVACGARSLFPGRSARSRISPLASQRQRRALLARLARGRLHPTWSALKAAGERALPANVTPDEDPADHPGEGPRDDEDRPIKGR